MILNRTILTDLDQRSAMGLAPVLGCDIFDTLVTRLIPKEQAFHAMCRAMAHRFLGSAADFHIIEKLYNDVYLKSCNINQTNGLDYEANTEYLFEHWCYNISSRTDLKIDRIMLEDCLVENEVRLLVAMPQALELVKNVRAKGYKILFISDMFYGEKIIRRILNDLGFDGFYDSVHVSSDYGLLKRTGRLFGPVLYAEGISSEALVFVGDDSVADVAQPLALNISAHHYVFDDVEDQRADLRASFRDPIGDRTSLLNGIVLAAGGPIFEYASAERFAVKKYFGLYFGSFGMFIAELYQKKNYGSVLMTAREGFLLSRITEIFDQWHAAPAGMTKSYLPASRLVALAFCLGEHPLSMQEFANLARNGQPCLRTVAAFLRLGEPALEELAREAGLASPDVLFHPDLLNWAPAHRVIAAINARAEMKEFRKQGDMFLKWFQQNGLQDGRLKLFVDLGWAGQIQDLLARGFARRGLNVALDGAYSGMRLEAHWRRRPGNDLFWFHSDEAGDDPLAMAPLWFPQILETLCRAPHGSAVGFRMAEDGVTVLPEFQNARQNEEVAEDALLCRTQELILEYVERFAYLSMLYGVQASEVRGLAVMNIFKFLTCPETEVARRFAGFCNISDLGSREMFAFRGGMGIPGRDDAAFAAFETTTLWPTGAAASFFGEEASYAYAEQHIRERARSGGLFRRDGLTAFNVSAPLNDPTTDREPPVPACPTAKQESEALYRFLLDHSHRLATEYERSEIVHRRLPGGLRVNHDERERLTELVMRALQDPHIVSWPVQTRWPLHNNELRTIPHPELAAAQKLAIERLGTIESMSDTIREREGALVHAKRIAEERYETIIEMNQMISERDKQIMLVLELNKDHLATIADLGEENRRLDRDLMAAAKLCEERLSAMGEMGDHIFRRDQKIETLELLIDQKSKESSDSIE
jgi:FMN phosphatase YigB (HAD superfamily)